MDMQISNDCLREELAPQVYEAFSRLARHLRAIELPYGLTNEKLSTLTTVAALQTVSVSALAKAEMVSLPTMSSRVTKLVAEGLVERIEHESDGRGVLVSITTKGSVICQHATQQSVSNLKNTLGAMQPEQLATIRILLSTLGPADFAEPAENVEHQYAIAPVGLAFFDTDLRFVYINEWLARINGLSVNEHLGRTVNEVIPEVAVGIVPQLRSVLHTGEPIVDGTVEAETPAHRGEKRHYMHNFYPDKSKDDTIVGVSCVVQDVTERIELEVAP